MSGPASTLGVSSPACACCYCALFVPHSTPTILPTFNIISPYSQLSGTTLPSEVDNLVILSSTDNKMILSPYHNPPYRSPTPQGASSPQTPKRKRENPTASSEAPLQIETQLQIEDASDTGANSPRTKVANRLKTLNIRQDLHGPSLTTHEPDKHRKRLKRQPGVAASLSPDLASSEFSEASKAPRYEAPEPTRTEVKESPDCRTKHPQSPTKSPTRRIAFVEITPPKRESPNQDPFRTTPPSSNLLASPETSENTIRSASPLPSKGDLTPDQAALTWQEDEITGHEIDPSGDDDGEGINGIGFRPTPAIAAARQQRRKQQVSEWRAREAREARQKRFERRRETGGVPRQVMSSPSTMRMVRFVGAGE